ncbi:ATP-binding cassette domain-containing protein [Longilinea arvoryzae]|nr:hypothetical protein [Longilinea arvoryzae]
MKRVLNKIVEALLPLLAVPVAFLIGAILLLVLVGLGLNEILRMVMMIAIAMQFSNYLMRGLMIDPKEIELGTRIAPYSHHSFLDFKVIHTQCGKIISDFNVKTPNLDTPVKNLSGGNIQKLILGRELTRRLQVLIASQPTRGVDIGASEYIHQRLLAERLQGTATLLISEDLDEIRALSDRIAVMYEGRIIGIIDNKDASPEKLGLMMAGVESA